MSIVATAWPDAKRRLSTRSSAILQTQIALSRIPAPTGNETARAQRMVEAFRRLGFNEAALDGAGNAIAKRAADTVGANPQGRRTSATNAPVVVMAHLDTVFPVATVLEPVLQGSRITCPGIGDNSRGLATMLALAEAIGVSSRAGNALQLRRPIEFVATVGEEGLGNLRGAHTYFTDRHASGLPDPSAVVVLDGPGASSVVHHGLGSIRYHIHFRGHGGHSWADFGNPNAVHAAGRATSWLSEMPRASNGRLALTVSRIGGGECVNAIPCDAWMDVDVRAMEQSFLVSANRELRALVMAAAAAEPETRARTPLMVDIAVVGERPCGAIPVEHPLVQLAYRATRVHGLHPVSAVASTDANVPLSLGIPAITIGGGGAGGGAHTLNEWYDNAEAMPGVLRAFDIVVGLAA